MFNMFKKNANKESEIVSPATGHLLPIEKVHDELFAQKLMGDGFAVLPNKGEFFSPVKGKITSIFPTKHAISIQSVGGLEILLHLGVDTVNLQGKPFDIEVKQGQRLKAGQLLGSMDLEQVREAGLHNDIIIVFTNMDKVSAFLTVTEGATNHGEKVGSITIK